MRYSKVLRIVGLLFDNSCNQQIHLIFQRNVNLSGSQLRRRGSAGVRLLQGCTKEVCQIVNFEKVAAICHSVVQSRCVVPTFRLRDVCWRRNRAHILWKSMHTWSNGDTYDIRSSEQSDGRSVERSNGRWTDRAIELAHLGLCVWA